MKARLIAGILPVLLTIAVVITLALLIGAADEIHQPFLPGRMAGRDDWLIDATGAGWGFVGFKRKVSIDKVI